MRHTQISSEVTVFCHLGAQSGWLDGRHQAPVFTENDRRLITLGRHHYDVTGLTDSACLAEVRAEDPSSDISCVGLGVRDIEPEKRRTSARLLVLENSECHAVISTEGSLFTFHSSYCGGTYASPGIQLHRLNVERASRVERESHTLFPAWRMRDRRRLVVNQKQDEHLGPGAYAQEGFFHIDITDREDCILLAPRTRTLGGSLVWEPTSREEESFALPVLDNHGDPVHESQARGGTSVLRSPHGDCFWTVTPDGSLVVLAVPNGRSTVVRAGNQRIKLGNETGAIRYERLPALAA